MNLQSARELENAQTKLARLEARYAALREETGGDEELRELTLESLKRSINEFQ